MLFGISIPLPQNAPKIIEFSGIKYVIYNDVVRVSGFNESLSGEVYIPEYIDGSKIIEAIDNKIILSMVIEESDDLNSWNEGSTMSIEILV